jgi:hypothetical protein
MISHEERQLANATFMFGFILGVAVCAWFVWMLG